MLNVIESIDHIEEVALSLGLSVKELYREADVDLSTRTRWRNGTTTPNFSTVAKLERVVSKISSKKE
jgi:predicted transcriptional regulator